MIATCGFLTALECTKFVLAGAVLRTPLGELTVLPRPGLREGKWKGKGGEEMGGGEITGSAPAYSKFCSHLLLYFTITAVLYHDGIMQFLFQ